VDWTLSNFHNRSGATASNFTIVDLPGRGLNFASGRMPAFTNGAGITYDIRFTLPGSDTWHTLVSGVDASQPFNFSVPIPGSVYYTAIGFFFGTVPANFGWGNNIVLTFVLSDDVVGNTVTNRFIVNYGTTSREGSGTVNVNRPGGNNPSTPPPQTTGRLPQTGLTPRTLLLGGMINIMLAAGLGTMVFLKRKRKK